MVTIKLIAKLNRQINIVPKIKQGIDFVHLMVDCICNSFLELLRGTRSKRELQNENVFQINR